MSPKGMMAGHACVNCLSNPLTHTTETATPAHAQVIAVTPSLLSTSHRTAGSPRLALIAAE
jgi:hypothetical protein